LGDFLDQAAFVRDALKTDKCRKIMELPRSADEEKRKFLESVFAERIHDDLMGILYLLTAEGRADEITRTLTAFINMGTVYTGRTTAYVVSATDLSEIQIEKLEEALSKKLKKPVDVEIEVDPSLIGGLYISVDGCLIDHTVKKQLSDLKESIKRGILK